MLMDRWVVLKMWGWKGLKLRKIRNKSR